MRQTFVEWAAQTINKSYWGGRIIGNSVTKDQPTRLQSGRWRLSGYGFFIVAGRLVWRMTSQDI
jgi:hypothetical protein